MYQRELTERAALLHRLRYPVERAIARLQANVEWEWDWQAKPAPEPRRGAKRTSSRPAALDDAAIATIVKAVYARHPAP